MLLEYGANVLRENHTLVAKRHHILKNVSELCAAMLLAAPPFYRTV